MAPGGAEISILNALAFSSVEEVHDFFCNPAILIPFAELCANCDVININNIPPYLAVQYSIAINKPGLGLKFWPGHGALAAIDKTDWTPADHFADFVNKIGASVFLGVISWPCLSFENGTDFLGPDCYQIALALSAVYRRNSVQRQLQQRTSSFTLAVQEATLEDDEDVIFPDFSSRPNWRLFLSALALFEARLG